jgi:hypothetical protein
MEDFMKVIGGLVVLIVVLAIVGFVNIWALNTLFPVLNIPYTIETWFASIIIFGTITNIKNRKD